jgi:hypothetical protein
MLAIAGERYPQSGAIAMSTLGAAGMISVGFVGSAMIANQQTTTMNDVLKENTPNVYARYTDKDGKLIPTMTQAAMEYDAADNVNLREEKREILLSAAREDVKGDLSDSIIAEDGIAITKAFNTGGRAALTNTSILPVGMAICFLGLLVYYKSIGGYKVLTLDDGGGDGGEDELGSDAPTDDADPLAVTTVEEGAEECCGGDEEGGAEGGGGG